MELAYRLATETSPFINQIRDNVYVSITPVADPDGRDRNVDWFYRNLELKIGQTAGGGASTKRGSHSYPHRSQRYAVTVFLKIAMTRGFSNTTPVDSSLPSQ